mmetsp:Transcript_28387/g.57678  ORF Transcript_28387/g.57678 Transcript_28387/m.57678 type:complete len:208 (+) Transcript_28387:1194-1817(+)
MRLWILSSRPSRIGLRCCFDGLGRMGWVVLVVVLELEWVWVRRRRRVEVPWPAPPTPRPTPRSSGSTIRATPVRAGARAVAARARASIILITTPTPAAVGGMNHLHNNLLPPPPPPPRGPTRTPPPHQDGAGPPHRDITTMTTRPTYRGGRSKLGRRSKRLKLERLGSRTGRSPSGTSRDGEVVVEVVEVGTRMPREKCTANPFWTC